MLKSKLLSSLILAAAITLPTFAHAQEDEIDSDLVEAELLEGGDEAAPAAEYPYPGAKEEGVLTAAPVPNLERPKRINEDTGDYYYDTKTSAPVANTPRGVSAPQKISDDGVYIYDPDLKTPAFSGRAGVEAPVTITADGEFNYAVEQSPRKANLSVRLGLFSAPDIENPASSQANFANIYTEDQLPVVFVDYEKLLTSKIGRLGLKFGSGLFVAQGKGIFATVDPGRRPDDTPEEQYSFFMFPNQLTGIYKFQYADNQWIVPYIEGGAGYFTFVELRDDNAGPKFGGSAVTVAAGGVNFLMDALDRKAIRKLDTEYGINHVWFTTEFRQIVGLNKTYDFTSSVVNLGVMMEF